MEGNLHITGRVKDLFKTSKGKYVVLAPIEDKSVMHDVVEACVVSGANLGQPLGIVMLDEETVAKIAEPAAEATLESSLAAHLKTINSTLDPHEQLNCIVLVMTAWTVDNDLITPTFKVKRNRVEDIYSANYGKLESSGQRFIWQSK